MDARKWTRFDGTEHLLACPVCGSALSRPAGEARLTCAHGHSFDIARQGYANLLRGGKRRAEHAAYDRTSFAARRRVFASGLYEPIAQALIELVADSATATSAATSADDAPSDRLAQVLDAGCGEGFFAERVRAATGAPVAAFDISKDSVQLAAGARADDGICWFVADLAAIPVQDNAVTCVLNVFSPANYQEFARVLVPGGRLVKVVPTARHLHEVRALAAAHLAHDAYSNERVLAHFDACCTRIEARRVTSTIELDAATREALVTMTPLLFNVDIAAIDWSGLTQATVEADILVGTPHRPA